MTRHAGFHAERSTGTPPYGHDRSDRVRYGLAIGFALVFSLVFTALVVHYSLSHGRLTFPPDYDDSHSLVEGALRWLTLRNHGWAAAWQEYLQRLPHSFLHYYFAASSFALFGIHAPVVYWTSSLFLFLALSGLIGLIGAGPVTRTIALLAGFLSLPAAFNLIFDFRSECALAALLFAGCCATIKAAWAEHTEDHWSVAAGILFAFALGIKPAMFPYTLGMAAGATSLVLLSPLLLGPGRWTMAIRGMAWIWSLMLLPFAFHYVLNWDWVASYILNIAFKSDLYQQSGTKLDQLLYHFLGFPGQFQLGRLAGPLLLVTLGANVIAAFDRQSAESRLRRYLFSITYLTSVAYGGVAVNSMVQNYFGMTFDFLLAASAAVGVSYLATRLPVGSGTLLCVAANFVAVASWQIPLSQDYLERTRAVGGDAAVEWRRVGPSRVFAFLRPYWRDPHTPTAWVATYGWVDGNTLAWESVREGRHWKIWNYYEKPPAPDALFPADAELLIVPEPGLMGTINVPCNAALDDLRQHLDRDAATRLLGTVVDPRGRSIRIYHRDTSSP